METALLILILFAILFIGVVPTIFAFWAGAPFVPTKEKAVDKLLKLADIKKGDVVYDIGCGDGRMVHKAANVYGANAFGIELSPPVYLLARLRGFLTKSKAKILLGDFRRRSLKDVDIIVCYMMPESLKKAREKFEKEMKTGSKIVSYAFRIKDWNPVIASERDTEKGIAPIWIYEIGKHKPSQSKPQ